MLSKIKEENYNLLRFNKRYKSNFIKTDTFDLFNLLDLPTENLSPVKLKTEVAVVSQKVARDLDHISP
jgi:hypothetical protein